jgi:hypothetical protein
LKWRSEQNVDNILEEDFSYWIEEFPCFTDGHDLTGRPGISLGIFLEYILKLFHQKKKINLVNNQLPLQMFHYGTCEKLLRRAGQMIFCDMESLLWKQEFTLS